MRRASELAGLFGGRGLIAGALAAALTVVAIGVPTVVVPNPFFERMTPTRPWDYAVLGLTALLAGLVVATYFPAAGRACPVAPAEGRLTLGGLLSFLAVGCPVCNKVAVLALGAGGALRYFAPIQPVLGLASLALLGGTAWLRLRALRAATPATRAAGPPAPVARGAE
ncbi:MAG TPA: hypothetical protein VFW96_15685 [Thermomicrobiales bacterium]|nr:hypothetical protein [Thermomicrobiales bacterium]